MSLCVTPAAVQMTDTANARLWTVLQGAHSQMLRTSDTSHCGFSYMIKWVVRVIIWAPLASGRHRNDRQQLRPMKRMISDTDSFILLAMY